MQSNGKIARLLFAWVVATLAACGGQKTDENGKTGGLGAHNGVTQPQPSEGSKVDDALGSTDQADDAGKNQGEKGDKTEPQCAHASKAKNQAEDPCHGEADEGNQGDQPRHLQCEEEASVALKEVSQMVVLSTKRMKAVAVLHSDRTGWFDLYNTVLAESGKKQHNESAYFRVTNSDTAEQGNLEGHPRYGNCGQDWIIQDRDNESTPTDPIYVGTFWLVEGENKLKMHHYCTLYRNEECLDFHIESETSGCHSKNANSVHFEADAICVQLSSGRPDVAGEPDLGEDDGDGNPDPGDSQDGGDSDPDPGEGSSPRDPNEDDFLL